MKKGKEKTFGEFLKNKRLKHGLFLCHFGVDPAGMSRLEQGIYSPTFRTLEKISRTYKMKSWQLLKEFETQ